MFKRGDRVRVVSNEKSSPGDEYFHVGDVGTVLEVGEADGLTSNGLFIQFDVHRNDDGQWYAYTDEVEHVRS